MPLTRGAMGPRKSTTSPNPGRINSTANLYELWNASASTPRTLQPLHSRPPPAALHGDHFGGSLGGPILHKSLFFFSTANGCGSTLPIVHRYHRPTSAFQSYVLQRYPWSGATAFTVPSTNPRRNWRRSIKKMFSLYSNTAGTPLAFWLPFNSDGSPAAEFHPTATGAQSTKRFALERRS